jgi:hypothetical protein
MTQLIQVFIFVNTLEVLLKLQIICAKYVLEWTVCVSLVYISLRQSKEAFIRLDNGEIWNWRLARIPSKYKTLGCRIRKILRAGYVCSS